MKTISEYLSIINNAKSILTSKLNTHGINTTGNTLTQLATKVGDIESGIKPNIFSQTTEPTTYDGIWINTDQTVNKLAQVEDFLSEWNSTYGTPMPIANNGFGYAKYNNKVYCIGGYTTSGVINTVYIYDLITNAWSIGTPITYGKYGFGCEMYNGKIYCIGGYSTAALNTNYIYDTSSDSWTTGTAIPAARSAPGSAQYDGKIYCIAGWTTTTNNTNYIYDTSANTWTTGAVLPILNHSCPCIANNGKIYCIAGKAANAAMLTNNYIYDIESNSWTTGAVIPQGKCGFGINIYNNKIYCIGGQISNVAYTNTNYIYDITGNSWTTGTVMSVSKYYFGCIIYDNLIYIIAGYNGSFFSAINIYSPDGPINIAIYNSDTLIMQHLSTTNTYNTILTTSNSFIGGFKYYFTDVAINSINADIYYGDGTQWIKIKSAT